MDMDIWTWTHGHMDMDMCSGHIVDTRFPRDRVLDVIMSLSGVGSRRSHRRSPYSALVRRYLLLSTVYQRGFCRTWGDNTTEVQEERLQIHYQDSFRLYCDIKLVEFYVACWTWAVLMVTGMHTRMQQDTFESALS